MTNTLIDWISGSIPVVGDLFEVGLTVNQRNVALLRRYIAPEADMIDITPNRAMPVRRGAA